MKVDYEIKRANRSHVIVEVEKQYNDKMGRFYVDPMFRRTENIVYSGVVKAIPDGKVTHELPNEQGGYLTEIDPILKVGDKVYFRYVGNDSEDNHIYKSISDTSESYMIAIHYSWVFAAVRDGEIIPCSGWILAEPIIEGGGEVIEIDGENGIKKQVKVEYCEGTSIIKEMHEKKSKDRAIVRYISSFIGHETELNVGDLIFGDKRYIPFENEINGKSYYCFREEYVLGIIS